MVKSVGESKKHMWIILAIIFALPTALVLYLLGNMALRPTLNKLDQDRFSKLDSDMQNLYSDIKKASSEGEEWRYDTACSPNRTGWAPTGDYNCITSISLQKVVTSVDELNKLHEKYYPVVDRSSLLSKKSELELLYPSTLVRSLWLVARVKNIRTSIQKLYVSIARA